MSFDSGKPVSVKGKRNLASRFSNLRGKGKKKELMEIERPGKASKSSKIKKGQTEENFELNEADQKVQEQIEASENVQKLVARFVKNEQKGKKNNRFKIFKAKRRKVGKDIYKRAYDAGKIQKVGYLSKQGGRVKSWKRRYFVLKPKMLFYFESLEAFEEGLPPKGWIWLKDMIPSKKNFVCTTTSAHFWRGKLHAFNIRTDKRTWVIASKGKNDKIEWMKTIQTVYEEFWTGYGLPVPVLKGQGGSEDDAGTLAQLKPLAEKLDTYDELEQNEIEDKTRLLMLAQCMIRWKTFVKLSKLENSKS